MAEPNAGDGSPGRDGNQAQVDPLVFRLEAAVQRAEELVVRLQALLAEQTRVAQGVPTDRGRSTVLDARPASTTGMPDDRDRSPLSHLAPLETPATEKVASARRAQPLGEAVKEQRLPIALGLCAAFVAIIIVVTLFYGR